MPEYKDVNKSDMLKYLNMIEEMVLEWGVSQSLCKPPN